MPKTTGSSQAAARIAEHKADPETLRSVAALKRAIPVGNKLCAVKEHCHMEKARIQRLKDMKPQVDAQPPKVKSMAHLRTNWKRDEIAACRFDAIETENRRLLNKMNEVAREHGLGSSSSQNTRNSRSMPSLPANSAFSFPGGPARKNEIIRIEKENMKMLHRLQNAHPEYDTKTWESAHRKTREYIGRISEYPKPSAKPKRRAIQPTASLTPLANDASSIQDVASEASAPDLGMRHVLCQERLIEGTPFLVEMATDGHELAVSASVQGETLELLVNEEDHRQLYTQAGGDYGLLAGGLKILEGQLVIDQTLLMDQLAQLDAGFQLAQLDDESAADDESGEIAALVDGEDE
jgi:hypothetical protein